MTPGLWLNGVGIFIASVAMGTGLGNYATGTFGSRAAADSDWVPVADQVGNRDAAYGPQSDGWDRRDGPTGPIVCIGCGPTLADRRMAAEMQYAMGYDDPVVARYLSDAGYAAPAYPEPETAPAALPSTPTPPAPTPVTQTMAMTEPASAGPAIADEGIAPPQ
jgi:hypothetical protein